MRYLTVTDMHSGDVEHLPASSIDAQRETRDAARACHATTDDIRRRLDDGESIRTNRATYERG